MSLCLRSALGLVLVTLGVGLAGSARAQQPGYGSTPSRGAAPNKVAAKAAPDMAEHEKPDGAPARVPWRGTSLSMTTEASSQLIGWGKNYNSGDYLAATMSFSAWLNYYLMDRDDDRVTVSAVPALAVELTNSDDTVKKHEPQFQDMPIWAAYSRTLFTKDLWATAISATGALILPTSKQAQGIGTYLTTSPRLSFSQTFPLAGEKSPVFKTIAISLIGRWDHRLGKATTAVNPNLNRPRQTASGETFLSDQLSFKPLATNTFSESIWIRFDEAIAKMPLTLLTRFSFSQSTLPDFNKDAGCIYISTGCAVPESSPNPSFTRTSWGFDANVIFQPLPEAGVWLAYGNSSNTLGADGLRRGPFWSPDAVVSASLIFYPDALYERLTGPRRSLAKNASKTKTF